MNLSTSLRSLLLLATSTLLTSTAFAMDLQELIKLQEKLPDCSRNCLSEGVKEFGCTMLDIDCQCSHLEAIIQSKSPCLVQAGCKLEQFSEVANVVGQLCSGQIAKLMSTPTPTPTAISGAMSQLPLNMAWTGAAAAAAVAVVIL